ncbi:hypothetical protein SAMN05216343_10120 [Oscillibacter sp. PC13]|nr:hypothetical protein SAMN05216343_10120 [Oscillibacter sp. PC13]
MRIELLLPQAQGDRRQNSVSEQVRSITGLFYNISIKKGVILSHFADR